MIPADEIATLIRSALPDAHVVLKDLTGGADHWKAVVVSQAFEGRPLIAQQRLVLAPLQGQIDSGRLHAFSMRTFTPERARRDGILPS